MDARLGVFAAKVLYIVSSQPIPCFNHIANFYPLSEKMLAHVADRENVAYLFSVH